ncbi:hypothetical protein FPV67DRAFT_1449041 [Lyophyllum atratum]|nr:hypothetical protein FPV67DRAFT_1449041 [Lyophyllum atratum]
MVEDFKSPTLPSHTNVAHVSVAQLEYSKEILPFLSRIVLMPLQSGDILRAVKTFQITFARDPMMRYVRNDREQNRAEMVMERLLVVIYLFCAIRAGIALTVDAGPTANVTASPPKDTTGGPTKGLITRIAERFLKVFTEKRKEMMWDPEAKGRRKEVDDKLSDAQKRALGDRVDKMWMVGDLWTEPAHQGHGYGGALLDAMVVLADLAGQATWL